MKRVRQAGLLGMALWMGATGGAGQQQGGAEKSQNDDSQGYTLQVSANEVGLTFHVSDENGKPLTNLTQDDVQVYDNNKLQKDVRYFHSFSNLPIRVGFLFDTSASMRDFVQDNRDRSMQYADLLLRKAYDRAFVMEFDTEPRVLQTWTDDPIDIEIGLGKVDKGHDRIAFTSIYDTLFRACKSGWQTERDQVTGNMIVLFSDGLDDASHSYMNEAIDMCQRSRTAIYVFTNDEKGASAGQKTLRQLAEQSGGRIFYNPSREETIGDLRLMEEDQRSQYRLVYRPVEFKPDGAFHKLRVETAVRSADVQTRFGYYALGRE